MRKLPSILKTASSVLALAGALALLPASGMAAEGEAASAVSQRGLRALAFCLIGFSRAAVGVGLAGAGGMPNACFGSRARAALEVESRPMIQLLDAD